MTRHEARQCAVQALYQIDLSGSPALDAISFALEDKSVTDADLAYIRTLVEGTRAQLVDIDERLSQVMERWSTERVGRVELNVLRLAMYELMFDHSIPSATILDEAVRLAKGFATETSGKFVNGVLAKVLPTVRSVQARESETGGKSTES
ncbi:transcription antitermination factor NusB [Alicyclobacillus fastidiosus]|uniref:Transcription antitermination protein NusB n=1 Tax=Alicyclobacillus fastidiosus TaxID=392011 RepID=A0ABY6ZN39_9BACL|nr:transcription antitermination factor NusB [Alicyclobacillus fastidiosus]WAH44299.1 transcription antitermination factor NusB [Alicyclobacillus fastidiosus]GMA60623.1 N utilization substance protein B [Alicyclobacillus fastidiosus]